MQMRMGAVEVELFEIDSFISQKQSNTDIQFNLMCVRTRHGGVAYTRLSFINVVLSSSMTLIFMGLSLILPPVIVLGFQRDLIPCHYIILN